MYRILQLIIVPWFLMMPLSLAASGCHSVIENQEPVRDFLREWGVKLLQENDKAFESTDYKDQIEWASRPGTVSFYTYPPYKTKFNHVYDEYQRLFSNTDPWMPEILRFTNSGTEANNMLYEFAEFAVFKRTGKKAKRAQLLYFGNPYGGTFGRIAEIGSRYQRDPQIEKQLHIPTPHARELNPQDPDEIKRLEAIEAKALAFIRKQVAKKNLEIGGIFFEPISANGSLGFFRLEFLQRLRTLADELQVPLMADEIFTGGGRTGKFWAVAHYGEFRPDIFTFGKGLGVSGIGYFNQSVEVNGWIVNRWRWPSWERSVATSTGTYVYPDAVLDNTSRVHPLALVQSLHILKRILKDKLWKAANEVGAYGLVKMKEKAHQLGFEEDIQGIGLLFHVGSHTDELVGKNGVSHYQGRWSPPLTIEKKEFDQLLEPSED